jgi:hypothetical protein
VFTGQVIVRRCQDGQPMKDVAVQTERRFQFERNLSDTNGETQVVAQSGWVGVYKRTPRGVADLYYVCVGASDRQVSLLVE